MVEDWMREREKERERREKMKGRYEERKLGERIVLMEREESSA